MEIEKQIKAHFANLGYEISITPVSKRNNKHTIEWLEGADPHRLPVLAEYYFAHDTKLTGYGSCIVSLENFKPEGHGISGICKTCGCTEEDACYDEDTGPCFWVKEDICSACATADEKQKAIAELFNSSK